MKKIIALLTILSAFANLFSQTRFHYGANAGVSGSKVGDPSRYGVGIINPKGGLSVLYDLKGRFQLQSGVNYVKKGYTILPNKPDINYKIRTSNIEIPIGLRMRLGRHYIGTGLFSEFVFHPTIQQNGSYLPLPKYSPRGGFSLFGGMYASYFWQFHQVKNGFMELGVIGQREIIWNPLYTAIETRYYSLNLQLSYYFSKDYEKYKPQIQKKFKPGYAKKRKF